MFIEAVSTIHIQSNPGHTHDLGLALSTIIAELGQLPNCISYLVARCSIDPDVWVVSSHWSTRRAMDEHFTDPALRPFIDLLATRAVRRIEFNSFFNKHADHWALVPQREAP